jgi:type I restriction enzyme M protein
MSNGDLNWITNFIWGIADDALRDLYVRGKYRDVILPMMVLRRLDAVLEPTKSAVLSMNNNLDKAGIANQDAALRRRARRPWPIEQFHVVDRSPSHSFSGGVRA